MSSHSSNLSPGYSSTLEVKPDACSISNATRDPFAARRASVKPEVSEIIDSEIVLPRPRLSCRTSMTIPRPDDRQVNGSQFDSRYSFYGFPAFLRTPDISPGSTASGPISGGTITLHLLISLLPGLSLHLRFEYLNQPHHFTPGLRTSMFQQLGQCGYLCKGVKPLCP